MAARFESRMRALLAGEYGAFELVDDNDMAMVTLSYRKQFFQVYQVMG